MGLKIILEIFKSIFLKEIIKKIFSFKSIRDTFIIFACISSIVVFYYFFKSHKYSNTGSEHMRYSNFISSKMKPIIKSAVNELFRDAKKNSYFFISLVEVKFSDYICEFKFKYIRGFRGGMKQSFMDIEKDNHIFNEKTNYMCDEWDTKEKLAKLANRRIDVDIENSAKDLLSTQKKWIEDGRANYKINYLTYYIKGYRSNSEFYVIQVASRKPLKKIIQTDIFDAKFQALIQELNKITNPIKWYEILNR